MRWYEIMLEAEKKFSTNIVFLKNLDSFDQLTANISMYLQHVKETNTFLYRGLSQDKEEIQHNLMFPRLYEVVFDKFSQQKKLIATRNSVYCGNKAQASDYGTVYIVLPSNDFNVTWSTEIYDLHTDWTIPTNGFKYYIPPYNTAELDGTLDLNEPNPKWYNLTQDQLEELVQKHNWWQDSDIENHIRAGLTSHEKWTTTEKWLLNYFKSLNYKSNDLSNALTSGNEVMIRASTLYMLPLEFEEQTLALIKDSSIAATTSLKTKADKMLLVKEYLQKNKDKLLINHAAGQGFWKSSYDEIRLKAEWDLSLYFKYQSHVGDTDLSVDIIINPKLQTIDISIQTLYLNTQSSSVLIQDPKILFNGLTQAVLPLLPNLTEKVKNEFFKHVMLLQKKWNSKNK